MQVHLGLPPLALIVDQTLQLFDWKDVLLVLGWKDREMLTIESYAKSLGLNYQWAKYRGELVDGENCYVADKIRGRRYKVIIFIECDAQVANKEAVIRWFDHHRPRDAGFYMPPAQYMEASSLGQFLNSLYLEPTDEDRKVAARDHCLPAAMRGECPGVDPEELKLYGQQSIADETGHELPWVKDCMEEFSFRIAKSPEVVIGDQQVIDFRDTPTGLANSAENLIAKQILANMGRSGLVKCKNTERGRDKIMMSDAAPLAILDFEEKWGPSNNLEDFFSAEARRYVGGFVKSED